MGEIVAKVEQNLEYKDCASIGYKLIWLRYLIGSVCGQYKRVSTAANTKPWSSKLQEFDWELFISV